MAWLSRSSARWKTAPAPARDDECAACETRDVAAIGARAYRCRVCGYEGGSGLAPMFEASRRATLAEMCPSRLRVAAVGDLRFARALLVEADDALAGLSARGVGRAQVARLQPILNELRAARRLILDALAALGFSAPSAVPCLREIASGDAEGAWDLALEMHRGVDHWIGVVG